MPSSAICTTPASELQIDPWHGAVQRHTDKPRAWEMIPDLTGGLFLTPALIWKMRNRLRILWAATGSFYPTPRAQKKNPSMSWIVWKDRWVLKAVCLLIFGMFLMLRAGLCHTHQTAFASKQKLMLLLTAWKREKVPELLPPNQIYGLKYILKEILIQGLIYGAAHKNPELLLFQEEHCINFTFHSVDYLAHFLFNL